MMVRAPIAASASIATNGPIETPAPSATFAAIALSGSTPVAGALLWTKARTAWANAVYGSRTRSRVHAGGGRGWLRSPAATMTAEARVVASWATYFGLATNVR